MKHLKKTFVICIAIVAMQSCTKSESYTSSAPSSNNNAALTSLPPQQSYVQLLCNKSWVLGQILSNNKNIILPCEADNEMRLTQGGSMTCFENSLCTSQTSSINFFSWKLTNHTSDLETTSLSNNKLKTTYKILKLNATTLMLLEPNGNSRVYQIK